MPYFDPSPWRETKSTGTSSASETSCTTLAKRVPFWRYQILGWTLFALFTIPVNFALEDRGSTAVASFVVRDGLSIALTLLMREVYDRAYSRSQDFLWIALTVASVSFGAGLLQLPIFLLFGEVFPSHEENLFKDNPLLGVFHYRTGVFAFWSLLYFMYRRSRDESERELQLLKAQMNPHLLSNALDFIIRETQQLLPKATLMLQALSNYVNYSLLHQKDHFVPMAEEYDALLDFLKLFKAAHQRDIDIGCRLEPSAAETKTAQFLLQPLVENAVKYGLQTGKKPVLVRMKIFLQLNRLIIEVNNTGRWVIPDRNRSFGGIGLSNLRRRLWHLYGRTFKFETLEEEGWVTVRLTLPIVP